jgi:hypothetical protein
MPYARYRPTVDGILVSFHSWIVHFYIYSLSTKNIKLIPGIFYFFSCGGGLEYLYWGPASRRKRRKGNPLPEGYNLSHPVTGGHIYSDLAFQMGGSKQGWRPCPVKRLLLQNPKKWKSDDLILCRQIWQNIVKKAMAQKGWFFSNDDFDFLRHRSESTSQNLLSTSS